ncbi:hypothetical protein V8F20_009409 [Naviculisporaceae sp. PSN 640]
MLTTTALLSPPQPAHWRRDRKQRRDLQYGYFSQILSIPGMRPLVGACCQGQNALSYIPLVYGCISTSCDGTQAQESWQEFLGHCARVGSPVDERDTPNGYEYVSVVFLTTAANTAQIGGPSLPTSGTGTGTNGDGTRTGSLSADSAPTGSTTTPPPEQAASDNSSKSGLGTGEIVGIALGAVSAFAALAGLYFRWKHLRLAKKTAGTRYKYGMSQGRIERQGHRKEVERMDMEANFQNPMDSRSIVCLGRPTLLLVMAHEADGSQEKSLLSSLS